MQTNSNNNRSLQEEESVIQQILSKYLPYWHFFVLSLLVGAGLAFIYLRYVATPVYEAKAAILIKDEKKGNEESKMVESLNQMSSNVIVENEVEILQSYTLMVNAVKSLHLYAPVFENASLHAISAYTKSPVIIEVPDPYSIKEFNDPDSIKKYKKIYFSYNENTQTVSFAGAYKYTINQIVNTPYGELKFLTNKYYEKPNKPVNQFYFSLINPKDVVPGLLKNLTVASSDKLSSFVNLSYKDEVPQRAEDILNELITSYRQSEISEKDTLAKNTLVFVTMRLNSVANELDSIEKEIQQYKSGKGAVDISTQGQLYLQNVSANDQKLSEVNTQLSVLDQVEKFVTNKENTNGIIPSTLGISDPTLSQLIDKLYTSQLEYEKLSKTVGENNPTLVGLRDQINNIKPDILQNIKSQEQSLDATKRNLFATNGTYNSILQAVPQKERQLLDISREQQIKSNIYAFLLQKREESELAYASTISNSRVVDMAHVSPIPVSLKKSVVYFIAILGCFGLCAVMIFTRELLLDKVQYRHEIESRTSIPIIAEIDFDKSNNSIVIKGGERSFIAEEFRKLRISLSFLGIDDTHKKILVTSGIAGEGKSFIAVNLAISLALSGKKVVLVDIDLHNPSLSKSLQLSQQDGVTEFLTGEKEPKEIINDVAAHENLFFIPAGSIPENPSELWATEKPRELINYLENIFDLVIIDTSPIILVNDGYILTGLCDATLYVIRQNYTPKMIIKKMEENNHINPINNPAIVFNGIKTRGFSRNYQKYGYNYGYAKKKRWQRKEIDS